MKTKKMLVTGLSLAASALFILGLAACAPDDPGPGPGPGPDDGHVCASKCPECGLCLDLECTESACSEKCGDVLNYNYIFDVTSLRVAKTNATVNPGGGCVEDFTKTQDASIVYKLKASDAATVTLTAYVSTTAEEDVFTDSIEVKVNNGEKLDRASRIPAGSGDWVQVNLGCIDLVAGSNEISFEAQGDGVKAHKFQKIELYGDLDSIELEQAQGLWHECTSKCEVCGKCLNFSCYNSGCAEKCDCESGAPAKIFWVCDERVKTNRDVNKELDGIGCSWGKCTTVVYTLTSPEATTVKYGAVVSVDTSERLFTEQFTVTVNGEQVPAGAGAMPIGPTREFNEYHLVIVGEMTLAKGINVIRIDQDLVGKTKNEWKTAYNFQSLIFFTDLDIDWSESEHTLREVPEVAATCKTAGTKAHWVCTDEDCGKSFFDEYGVEEADAAALVIPADETKHVFDVTDGKVTCTVCETEMTNIFNGLDEKVLFEELKGETYEPAAKTMTDDQMPDGKGYLPNVNKTVRRITYFIDASKETEVYLWTNNSAIATHYLIEYGKTWQVYVNGTQYDSKTIHHNTDGGGGTDKLRNFKFEFVAKIVLSQGINKIEFVSTGAESCNFRDLGLMGSDATFTLAENPNPTPAHECESKCIICGKCTNAGCTEEACSDKCTEHTVKGTFDPLDDKVEFTNKDGAAKAKDPKNEGHVAFSNGETNVAALTFYIDCDKATTADLWTNVSAIASGSVKYTESWKVTVNGTEVTSETIHHTYDSETSSAKNKYFDYVYEFVANISLKAGVNVIVFTSTGAESLNFDMLALGNFGDDTASVTLVKNPVVKHECESKCIICGKCTNADCPEEACSDKCTEHTVNGTFDPLDDKVVFEKKNDDTGEFSAEGVVKDAKNEGHVGFSNAKSGGSQNIARLTFYIDCDKATTADLWTNVSAIASGSVKYTESWKVTVNGTEITSETIHHIYDKSTSSAANRYFDYAYELIASISLKEGVNVIEFTSTGAQALNFDMLALVNLADETATVTLTEKPAVSPAQAVAALPAAKRDF